MARVVIKGQKEIVATLSVFSRKFAEKIPKALTAEMKIELAEVKKRTPVDTGDLVRSEIVTEPVKRGRTTSVGIQAGSEKVFYAWIVHEDLDMNHPRGGQAKYIESVLMESRPFMRQRVAARLQITKEDL